MAIYQLGADAPDIDPSAYIADSAQLIGKVKIDAGANIWFNATLRGDNELIWIGRGSNVQESSVLHTDPGCPLSVAENVTIGHQAMLHGCTIEAGALIGIQAVVLNRARIGKNCLVGAGALVTEGKQFAEGSLIIGSPAKAVRLLSADEIAVMHANTANYVTRGQRYQTDLQKIG